MAVSVSDLDMFLHRFYKDLHASTKVYVTDRYDPLNDTTHFCFRYNDSVQVLVRRVTKHQRREPDDVPFLHMSDVLPFVMHEAAAFKERAMKIEAVTARLKGTLPPKKDDPLTYFPTPKGYQYP